MNYLKTPILITAWNRPEKVRILINSLKVLKPENLYFSCDGPRNENINELEKTNQTRKIINENIDWECNVKKNFNDTNLGCRVNMIKSINWVFESNEMAIILEDDCIPKPEFFKYCYLLLKKYEKDFEIWNINGTNLQNGNLRGNGSYYFSKYFHSWGWATWKNRWLRIDDNLDTYESFKNLHNKKQYFLNKSEEKYWLKIWDNLKYHEKPDSWAYRWLYTCISNKGLNITPNINLINNIGFDMEASNTKIRINKFRKKKNIKTFSKKGLLNHPKTKIINFQGDKYTFDNSFKISLLKKLYLIISNPNYYIKKIYKLIKSLV